MHLGYGRVTTENSLNSANESSQIIPLQIGTNNKRFNNRILTHLLSCISQAKGSVFVRIDLLVIVRQKPESYFRTLYRGLLELF